MNNLLKSIQDNLKGKTITKTEASENEFGDEQLTFTFTGGEGSGRGVLTLK